MRIVQLTDTHIYDAAEARFDGVDTRESLARVLDHVRRARLGADLLVVTGDLSMDGVAAAYAHLDATLVGLAPRVICIPGNHDDPDALARHAPRLEVTTPRVLDVRGWRLLFVDSRVRGVPHGGLDPASRAWLRARLSEAEAGRRAAVLFVHHPPFALGCPWLDAMGLRDAEALWQALAGTALSLVVCGHVHQNHDAYRGAVRLLTTPSTCVQFRPRSPRYATDRLAPGYRVIDLARDGSIASHVVRVPGVRGG